MAEHALGAPGSEHVSVIDAVPTRQHRAHQGHGLVAYVGVPRGGSQVEVGLHQFPEPQPPGHRGWEDQTGMGHGVVVIEGHPEAVQAVR